jgi:hypothetical protein
VSYDDWKLDTPPEYAGGHDPIDLPCEWCGAPAGEECADGCGPEALDEDDDLNDSNDWESTP